MITDGQILRLQSSSVGWLTDRLELVACDEHDLLDVANVDCYKEAYTKGWIRLYLIPGWLVAFGHSNSFDLAKFTLKHIADSLGLEVEKVEVDR